MTKAKTPSEATLTSTDRLEVLASEAVLDSATLAGDLRDVVLDLYKSRPKPWSQLSSEEQSDVIRAIEYATNDLVKRAVDLIRSDGMDAPVKAILESYTEKDGIKASLKIKTIDDESAGRAVLALHKARGKLVLVTLASADDYLGDRGDVEVDADQRPLDFASGSDTVTAEEEES